MENHVVIESKGRLAAIRNWMEPVLVLLILGSLFGYLGSQMGLSAMVNTLFNTAHQLLLNTVLFIMGITVLSGALSQLLSEFGVIRLLEVLLAPLMKPVFRLPGRTALAALMTFFSDKPGGDQPRQGQPLSQRLHSVATGVAHQLRHRLRHGADRGHLYGHPATAER